MSRYLLETIEYKGFNIKVYPDECAESPREWGSSFTIAAKCEYRIDNETIDDPIDYLFYQMSFSEEQKDWWLQRHNYNYNHELLNELLTQFSRTHIWLNVYMYEHGNVAFSCNSFSCRWDSGQVGWIYISKEDARKEWGWDRITNERLNDVYKWMEGEVEVYSQYASGSVYYYDIENSNEEDIGECCGGFYGYDHEESGLLEYAQNAIDCYIKNTVTKKEEEDLIDISL